jgi:hypothetical protein
LLLIFNVPSTIQSHSALRNISTTQVALQLALTLPALQTLTTQHYCSGVEVTSVHERHIQITSSSSNWQARRLNEKVAYTSDSAIEATLCQ